MNMYYMMKKEFNHSLDIQMQWLLLQALEYFYVLEKYLEIVKLQKKSYIFYLFLLWE